MAEHVENRDVFSIVRYGVFPVSGEISVLGRAGEGLILKGTMGYRRPAQGETTP